jgi:alpha-L-rhamnosidase
MVSAPQLWFRAFLSAACLAGLSASSHAAELAAPPRALRCEYRADPLGIDVANPRLFWQVDDARRNAKQTAYQILVAGTPENLAADRGDLWDTGKVLSDQSTHVVYAGKPLPSRTRCYWKVRLWDAAGSATPYSPPATWSMGLLKMEDWHARWIRPAGEPASANAAISPWIRKTFELPSAPQQALAYVNALGYCELYVNGRKIGGDVLTPAVSDFRTRSFYVTYDIAPWLRKGRNCIGLWLGQGWHTAGRLGVQTPGPVVRFQADIHLAGKNLQIASDETWRSTPSPYTTLGPWAWDQFGGERYDARLANPAWCDPVADDRQWAAVQVVSPPDSRCQAQACPTNRIGRRIPAVTCTELRPGLHEIDFGTNLAGWLRLQLPTLPAGTRVSIRYADQRYPNAIPEPLPPGVDRHGSDETFDSANGKVRYQTFHQADEFISAGRPGEVFCSKFNYHGFRYAIVEGLPAKPALLGPPSPMNRSAAGDPASPAGTAAFAAEHGPLTTSVSKSAEALLIESDLEPAGSFSCSNELFNRIYRLHLWTIRCLDLGGYMVDCPHRERMGYGDGQVGAETCIMNFWMPNLYEKWLGDWRDGQDPATGDLPHVAPRAPGGGGPAWGGNLAALAWQTYRHYGDRRVLEDCYQSTRRYVDYLESRSTDGILHAYGGEWDFLGDWVPPGRGMDTKNWPPARANEVFNNCYRVFLWELLEKSAEIRPLIHKAFYDPAKQDYALDEQAYLCLPLLTRVVPASEQTAILKKLEKRILVDCAGHLDTGNLGSYFLIRYLSEIGRDDLLFTILNQKTYPGWGYMVERDATTIWEQWNGYYSQIHSCFISAAGWFHYGLAGIQLDPTVPGFKKIVIRPAVVGDLTWVKCSHRSIHGTIVSNWTRKDNKLILELTIPPNTTATVYLPTKDAASVTESGRSATQAEGVRSLPPEPGRAVFAVGSGSYTFSAAL